MLAVAQPTQEEARRMAYAEAQRQGVDPAELEAPTGQAQRHQHRHLDHERYSARIQPIVEEEIAKMKAEQAAKRLYRTSSGTWFIERYRDRPPYGQARK